MLCLAEHSHCAELPPPSPGAPLHSWLLAAAVPPTFMTPLLDSAENYRYHAHIPESAASCFMDVLACHVASSKTFRQESLQKPMET